MSLMFILLQQGNHGQDLHNESYKSWFAVQLVVRCMEHMYANSMVLDVEGESLFLVWHDQ